MLFMLRMSVGILPLVPMLYQYWIAIALLAAALVFAQKRSGARTPNPAGPRKRLATKIWVGMIAALCIGPLSALSIGTWFWEASPMLAPWLLRGLWALGIAQVALGAFLIRRHGQQAGPIFFASAVAATWMAGAISVATMAVTGTWL